MSKNYQISEELFLKLMNYFLSDENSNEDFEEIAEMIQKKCNSIIRRNLYSAQFDKSLSAEQREQARQAYLDEIGMSKDFRY